MCIIPCCQVMEVEQEMRELLSENEASKRAMEERAKKMARVMNEFQQGLF